MVLPQAIRKEQTKVEQILKIPQQRRIEVQNVLASSVKVYQLTKEIKEVSRKLKVAISEYEHAATEANAMVISSLLIQKKTAKDELSVSKREFMLATNNYIDLGGLEDVTPKETEKGTV
jgi:hypothetical protein